VHPPSLTLYHAHTVTWHKDHPTACWWCVLILWLCCHLGTSALRSAPPLLSLQSPGLLPVADIYIASTHTLGRMIQPGAVNATRHAWCPVPSPLDTPSNMLHLRPRSQHLRPHGLLGAKSVTAQTGSANTHTTAKGKSMEKNLSCNAQPSCCLLSGAIAHQHKTKLRGQ
jgi:hypothetical protein